MSMSPAIRIALPHGGGAWTGCARSGSKGSRPTIVGLLRSTGGQTPKTPFLPVPEGVPL